MSWRRLLSPERCGGDRILASAKRESHRRSVYVKDYDRIVYSSAFRRLQGKTQVFPFPESDYVRTRLTHSLEVSSVGRSLGLAVGHRIAADDPDSAVNPQDFADIVAAASLAHDIGHPPFGHAGEESIRHFFRHEGAPLLADLAPVEKADLTGFEANAQGFRIVSRLQFWRDRGGMQLCCAVLGAFSKYPWGSLRDGEPGATTKFGFYRDDESVFRAVAQQLGLIATGAASWCRHPLAYLVEAADDICYLVVDIEDSCKADRLDPAKAEEVFRSIIDGDLEPAARDLGPDDLLSYLRSKAIGALLQDAVEAYMRCSDRLMSGVEMPPLLEQIERRATIAELRAFSHERLYQDERKVRIELGGFAIVRGLLNVYAESLSSWEKAGFDLESLPYLRRRVLSLLPELELFRSNRYGWLLRMVDYVAGMTNRYAVSQHGLLTGSDLVREQPLRG